MANSPPASSNDPLQKLLRESLHLQLLTRSRQTASLRARAQQIEAEYRSRLHDKVNWTPSGIVTVIHTAEDGTQTTIGKFQELRNKYFKDARRLIRIQSDEMNTQTETDSKPEFVSGQLWINGKQVLTPEPTYHPDPAEQALIRDYIKRTSPIALAQQLRDLQAEHLLQQLFSLDVTWKRV